MNFDVSRIRRPVAGGSEVMTGRDCQTTAERGFTLTELMIAMVVFTIIMGSVITLVTKSQSIFTTQQGVS